MHGEQGYCPVCQDIVTLLVMEARNVYTYECPRHPQFCHRVSIEERDHASE